MLPGLGFTEILVIALLAIIVIGPADLPKVMRKLSAFLRQIRMMGNEFKQAFADMDKDGELAELRKELEEIKNLGRIGDLSDQAFEEEMRRLDADIRDGVNAPHPRQTDAPKAAPGEAKAEPEAATKPKPKPKPKPKSAAKPKQKATPKTASKAKPNSKTKPKTLTKSKPKPKPKTSPKPKGEA